MDFKNNQGIESNLYNNNALENNKTNNITNASNISNIANYSDFNNNSNDHRIMNTKIIKDRVIKYKDNIDTDVIIPARYLNTTNPEELAAHCFEDLDKDFQNRVKKAKIIVAGFNFGCGSSREHAPLAIKASNIKLVIAKTFARIFFRNAINIGLLVIPCVDAAEEINDLDQIEVNLDAGIIYNITQGKKYKINPVPDFIQEIISSGGYINYAKKVLGKQ